MSKEADDFLLSKEKIYAEAFKRGFFDFITTTDKGRHEKQHTALEVLTNKTTQELLYGGAAGGAKSWTGCVWLLFNCINYPGTRWFIGRNELSRIEQSTLITFFKCAKEYGINSFKHVGNQVIFACGSVIDLLELKFQPRDKLYERFGSTEYTGGWIEEGGEVHFGAYDILKTRIGRHMNDLYEIIGKILITANPKKNWLYTTFYLPFKKQIEDVKKKFITVLATENPHIDSGYVERLNEITDPTQRARLRDGEWDYDDSPNALCSYENIISIFTNTHVQKTGDKRITADVARFGSDKARICAWDGWVMIDRLSFDISATTEIQDAINALRSKHGIPKSKTTADDDGVGGGVVDNCGIVGFVNNAAPMMTKEAKDNYLNKIEKENYANLQTQCVYGLAEKINKFEVYIECELSQDEKDEITTELGYMQTFKADDDRKLRILPKDQIKALLGHSPDWRDVIMMNYVFELVIPFKAPKTMLPRRPTPPPSKHDSMISDLIR